MKKYITADEAITLLPDEDSIHTFVNLPFGLCGADWNRYDVVKRFNKPGTVIELAGDQARNIGHGIAVYSKDAKMQSDILFVETDKDKLDAFDKEEVSEKHTCSECIIKNTDACSRWNTEADEVACEDFVGGESEC